MILIDYFRKQSQEYEMPVWKLPDFLFLMSGLMNGGLMILTYWLATNYMEDPAESVFVIALESILILFLTNIIVESSKNIMKGSRLKKEFINIISHQVRSPLTNIKWSVELINKDDKNLNDTQKEIINQIAASTERIQDLVNDFLCLSRMEEKKNLQKEEIDINRLIQTIKEANIYLAKIKKVEIEFNKLENPLIKADLQKLKLILDNLIDNAIKYSFPDTQIKINTKKEGKKLLFSIMNKGCGITKEDKNNIFTKFFRGANGKKMHVSGTGLGLFISYNMAKQLKGKLSFDSKVNKKTIFYLEIPIANN